MNKSNERIGKILIINPNQFGYHTDYYYYAKYLKESHNVHYICFDRKRKKIELPGINIIYLKFPRIRLLRSIYFLIMTLYYSFKNKFDIIFTNYFKLVLLIGLFCRSEKKILDIRTGSIRHNNILRKLDNLNIYLASLTFNKVTIISDGLARIIKLKNYFVLPLGSDIYYNGDHIFEQLKLLYVGTLNQRDIVKTIEAVNLFKIANNKISITYDIIGFGSESEVLKIKDAIKKYHLDKIVTFHGRKTNLESRIFFKECNVGISHVPITPWYDNQPVTKTYEYILSGMICLGTATYENKKTINKINGVLYSGDSNSLSDAINFVWENRENYNSSNIRSTLTEFTWENIIKNKLEPLIKLQLGL
ncbi:MAG: hypothetical protein WAV89_00115 [Ignavibacteriaceae bacterium]